MAVRPDRIWLEVETEVLDRLLHGVSEPLSDARPAAVPGVYLLFFDGQPPLPCYDHPGMVDGRWPCYAGAADTSLAKRMTEHRHGLKSVKTLRAETLRVIFQEMPNAAAAKFAETMAISSFQPVLNKVVRGFGAKPQGSKRSKQARSPFAALHPGRPGPTGPPKVGARQLEAVVRAHLARTVPLSGAWPAH